MRSPADRMVDSLDGQFYKLTEVAAQLSISESTLRRLQRRGVLKAPSYQINQGGMKIYLYTPEDVQEIRDHYARQVPVARITYPAERILNVRRTQKSTPVTD